MTKVDSDRPSARPGHPVRDRPHLDRRQHRLAEPAVVEQRLQGAHRLVVPHVLVDLKEHAGPLARLDQRRGLRVRHRQRLLRQDAPDATRMVEDAADHVRLLVGRHGDIDHLDRRVVEHLLQGPIDLRDSPQRGHFLRGLDRPRRDPDHAEPGVGVGHQVAIADDEARADDADPGVSPSRKLRSVIQGLGRARWHPSRSGFTGVGRENRTHGHRLVIQLRGIDVQGFPQQSPRRPARDSPSHRAAGTTREFVLDRPAIGPRGRSGDREQRGQGREDEHSGLPEESARPPVAPTATRARSGQPEQDDVGLAGLVGRPGDRGEAAARPGCRRLGTAPGPAVDAIAPVAALSRWKTAL